MAQVEAMHNLLLEEDSFGTNPSMKDLVRHLYVRMSCGKVVIVANNPVVTLSALRKQWLRFGRSVQRERSSTLRATRIYELSRSIIQMQSLHFSIKWSSQDYPSADVCVVTLEQILAWPPEQDCRTLYVAREVTTEQLYVITAGMARGGLIVRCLLSSPEATNEV